MSKRENIASKRVPQEAKIIGANLRSLRKEAGLSGQDLGDILGVSYQQIQKYESGSNRFPVERLYILKHYFDVPYERFLTGLSDDNKIRGGRDTERQIDAVCMRLICLKDTSLKDKILQITAILLS